MHIEEFNELRNCPPGLTTEQWAKRVRDARDEHIRQTVILASREERTGAPASDEDARKFNAHSRQADQLNNLLETHADFQSVDFGQVIQEQRGSSADGHGPATTRGNGGGYENGKPLTRDQSFEGFTRELSRRPGAIDGYVPGDDLDTNAYFRGILTGRWGNGSDRELRAMAEATGGGGGYAVPTILASQIIDLARAQTQVLKAGARIVPMGSKTVDIAKWTGDPSAAWRSEGAAISPTDATLGKVTLTAQTLAAQVIASRELIEDAPNVGTEVVSAIAKQVALKLDLAALYGSGTAPEPRGIVNQSGVTLQANGAAGTSLATANTWDWFVDAVGTLQAANENPSGGIIVHPRTSKTVAKFKDSTGQPLARPSYLDGFNFLPTTQVKINNTVGASTDCSDAFLADWSQLLVGVRTELRIEPLKERYADNGQVAWIAWFRADIQVARPAAFVVINGIRP